jgi:hypothetical protein
VIGCTTATYEKWTPDLIASQVSDDITHRMMQKGFQFGADLIRRHRKTANVNTERFKEYITMALIFYVNELRVLDEFAEKEAILLMDKDPSHPKDEILSILTWVWIKGTNFAPRTTHIFQMLNLLLFNHFKRRQQYIMPMDSVFATVDYLTKIMHNLLQT